MPGHKLRHLIRESADKGPLHLLQKLIPLVFSLEEIALSCGQGIGVCTSAMKEQTTGELKKPLDNVKIQVLKGIFSLQYITCQR